MVGWKFKLVLGKELGPTEQLTTELQIIGNVIGLSIPPP